jgi:hypothetical protein
MFSQQPPHLYIQFTIAIEENHKAAAPVTAKMKPAPTTDSPHSLRTDGGRKNEECCWMSAGVRCDATWDVG